MTIGVLGHRGMVGSAIVRACAAQGIACRIDPKSSTDLRLPTIADSAILRMRAVDAVILCAARVGGIGANSASPVEFLDDNLRIASSVIKAAHHRKVPMLVYLGSSCIYPKHCRQPMREEDLLTGPLEPTNEAYAIAKIAGIRLCQAYERQYGMKSLILMPCNLYGPGDNFNTETGHVIPAMIRKAHEAKVSGQPATFWGSGAPQREFMHVDDFAAAALHLIERSATGMVNVGSGVEHSLSRIADMVLGIVGGNVKVDWDLSKPDGTMRKLLDLTRLRSHGWDGCRTLHRGVSETYQWYLANQETCRK